MPTITDTVPGGWLIAGDAPDYFALQPVTSDAGRKDHVGASVASGAL